jgi:hypothetical protein
MGRERAAADIKKYTRRQNPLPSKGNNPEWRKNKEHVNPKERCVCVRVCVCACARVGGRKATQSRPRLPSTVDHSDLRPP